MNVELIYNLKQSFLAPYFFRCKVYLNIEYRMTIKELLT